MGFGVGFTGLGLAAFLTGIPVACFGGGYLISRKLYSIAVGRRSRALNELMDEMVGIMEGGGTSGSQGALPGGRSEG